MGFSGLKLMVQLIINKLINSSWRKDRSISRNDAFFDVIHTAGRIQGTVRL